MTTRTPECRCLNCGNRLSAVSGFGHDDGPSPGDLTVCIKCGAVMKIADDLTVRGMTESEMDEISNDREYMSILSRLVQKIQMIPKLN